MAHGAPPGGNEEAGVEYWGLPSICKRMQWRHRLTPVRHALKFGFPLYLRRRQGHRRQMYYSNEKLIKAWEWARCEQEIARLISAMPAMNVCPLPFRPESNPERQG